MKIRYEWEPTDVRAGLELQIDDRTLRHSIVVVNLDDCRGDVYARLDVYSHRVILYNGSWVTREAMAEILNASHYEPLR